MRWFYGKLLVPVLLLGIGFPGTLKLPEWQTGSIAGFVSDDKGAPIAGALIEIRDVFHGQFTRTRSQPSGMYAFTGLVSGRYDLFAEAKDHDAVLIPSVIVEEGRPSRLDIQLTRNVAGVRILPVAAH